MKQETKKEKKERYQISFSLCIVKRKKNKSKDKKGKIHEFDDIRDYNDVLRYQRYDHMLMYKMYDEVFFAQKHLSQKLEKQNKFDYRPLCEKIIDKIKEEVFNEIIELNTKAFESLKIIKYLENNNIECENKEITTDKSNFSNIRNYYIDYNIEVSLTQNQLKEIEEKFEYDNVRIYNL